MSVTSNEDAHPLDENLLTARVHAVDGVTAVYPPAPTLTQISHLLTAVVTGDPQRLDRVDVRTDGATTAMTVRVGTSIDMATPDTATRVADALLQNIPGGHDATVTVQVSRIA